MPEPTQPFAALSTAVSSISIKDGVATVAVTEDGHAFGTKNNDFIDGLANQIINATCKGQKPDEKGVAFMASMIGGVNPRDQVESMLATQMAAVHNAMMTFTRRLNGVETIPQQDSAARAFNQLARTFAAQVEALKRYRNGGNQSVTVKHVHVHEGGQAIVGNVAAGGRAGGKN